MLPLQKSSRTVQQAMEQLPPCWDAVGRSSRESQLLPLPLFPWQRPSSSAPPGSKLTRPPIIKWVYWPPGSLLPPFPSYNSHSQPCLYPLSSSSPSSHRGEAAIFITIKTWNERRLNERPPLSHVLTNAKKPKADAIDGKWRTAVGIN